MFSKFLNDYCLLLNLQHELLYHLDGSDWCRSILVGHPNLKNLSYDLWSFRMRVVTSLFLIKVWQIFHAMALLLTNL